MILYYLNEFGSKHVLIQHLSHGLRQLEISVGDR